MTSTITNTPTITRTPTITPTFGVIPGNVRVCVAGASLNAYVDDVITKIGIAHYSGVSLIITHYYLSQNYSGYDLSTANYDVFFVWSDYAFTSSLLGPNINNFVSSGGGLVICAAATSGVSINGFDYSNCPFTYSSAEQIAGLSLIADIPTYPILHDVLSFSNGTLGLCGNVQLRSGATQAAHLSNGYPLVGTLEIGGARTVGLNFYPPSSDGRSDFWDATTDGDILMLNSILWAAHKIN
jgi:hypothetical protein